MKGIKKFLLTAVAVAMIAPAHLAQARSVSEIQKDGQLIMGTSPDYPPFEWVDVTGGKSEVVGIDIAVAEAIAKELGVELKVEEMQFSALIQSVMSDKVDLSLGGFSYTKERAKQIDFSDTYLETVNYMVVPLANKDKYKSLDDFKNLRIAVQKGSLQETTARKLFPDADIVSIDKNGDSIQSLLTDRVDAVMMDDLVLVEFVEQHKDKLVALTDLPMEAEGQKNGKAVVIQKGNDDLTQVVNETIEALKASGELDEIIKHYTSKVQEETAQE